MTIDEMAKQRDPVYAAMLPVGAFDEALDHDLWAEHFRQRENKHLDLARSLAYRDASLLPLAIRALRNRSEPYYTQEVTA